MTRSGASKAKVDCCRDFMALTPALRGTWPWQVLHQYAHSRTTFSVDTFAEVARIEPVTAAAMLGEAQRMRWVWPAQPAIWVGRLAPKRR